MDEEGRSIVAEFENHIKDLKLEEPSMHASNEKTPISAEPEELSNQENQLNSKLIITNEIPSGMIFSEKNFSYEGRQYSNNKSVLLTSPEQIEYYNFEDTDKDEPKVLFEQKNKVKKSRNVKRKGKKNMRKIKNKKVLEKQEFSPPELDFDQLELKSSLNSNSGKKLGKVQNLLNIPKNPKDEKKILSKKYIKYPKYGYDDLQFEITENDLSIPILPSIETGKQIRSASMIKEIDESSESSFQSKKSSEKREPEGYTELLDIEKDNPADEHIQIIGDNNFSQITMQKMPKRSIRDTIHKFNTQTLNNYPSFKKSEDTSGLNSSNTKEVLHNSGSGKIFKSNENKVLNECCSEIFESCEVTCETNAGSRIKDLLCIPRVDNSSGEKINIPKSNLPKRKNK